MKPSTLFKTSIIILLFISIIYLISSANQQPVAAFQHPACCASEDGLCRDIGVPEGQTGCGKDHPMWTFISDKDFCNQFDQCYGGQCRIRTHLLKNDKEYYECVATCVEAGECKCNGDLSTCTGQFTWEKEP